MRALPLADVISSDSPNHNRAATRWLRSRAWQLSSDAAGRRWVTSSGRWIAAAALTLAPLTVAAVAALAYPQLNLGSSAAFTMMGAATVALVGMNRLSDVLGTVERARRMLVAGTAESDIVEALHAT